MYTRRRWGAVEEEEERRMGNARAWCKPSKPTRQHTQAWLTALHMHAHGARTEAPGWALVPQPADLPRRVRRAGGVSPTPVAARACRVGAPQSPVALAFLADLASRILPLRNVPGRARGALRCLGSLEIGSNVRWYQQLARTPPCEPGVIVGERQREQDRKPLLLVEWRSFLEALAYRLGSR